MKPALEPLEDKITPAPLLHVSPTDLDTLKEVAQVYKTVLCPPQPTLTIDLGTAHRLIVIADLPNPQWEGEKTALHLVKLGSEWRVEDVDFGVGEVGYAWSERAKFLSEWYDEPVGLFELTTDPVPTAALPATTDLVNTLIGLQAGDSLVESELDNGLSLRPSILAAKAPTGELDLQLATTLPDGSKAVHHLQSADDGRTWTLIDRTLVVELTPALGLWELKV